MTTDFKGWKLLQTSRYAQNFFWHAFKVDNMNVFTVFIGLGNSAVLRNTCKPERLFTYNQTSAGVKKIQTTMCPLLIALIVVCISSWATSQGSNLKYLSRDFEGSSICLSLIKICSSRIWTVSACGVFAWPQPAATWPWVASKATADLTRSAEYTGWMQKRSSCQKTPQNDQEVLS